MTIPDAGSGSSTEMSPDQQDLLRMQRVAGGDLEAFEDLIETHQARVLGMVEKMLGDSSDSEDIAQQVFIRVWDSAKRYKPTAKFTTWLFTITRNLVFNEIRRRKRFITRHPREEHDIDPVSTISDTATARPDAALLDAELQDAIRQAIAQLPETQRMALILRRYEEMPYEEIASVLHLTVPAVKSVLFRARTDLRVALAKYLTGEKGR